MNITDERCLILFVKYPEKGQVKMRLSRDIGDKAAAELYRNFVMDLLATLNRLPIPLWICFYPNHSKKKFYKWLGTQYFFVPQKGTNLGERMKNAFLQAFSKRIRWVILVGSDIPDLTGNLINEAFLSLTNHDAVIGPASDGGYYLIGFRNDGFIPESFDGISWSTNTVLEETKAIFEQKKLNCHLLPKWNDIDTVSDLKDLFIKHQETKFRHSKTISYILNMKLL